MSLSRRKRVLETALRIVVGSLSDRCQFRLRCWSIVVGSLSDRCQFRLRCWPIVIVRPCSSIAAIPRFLRLRRSLRCADRHAVSIVPLVPIVTPERIATSRRSRRRRK